ncbi:MAG: DUF3696 domain-containing protein [Pyrinomonadaceae bacterium]
MQIHQLRLENFRIFKKAQADFRPLTLLTGANSSGKSSVLSAITAVLQSQSPHTFPFQFVPNGKTCSLGSYKDIAHGRSTRTKFSIGLSLRNEEEEIVLDGRYRYSASGDQVLPDKVYYKKKENSIELLWSGQEEGYRAIIHADTHNEMLKKEFMVGLKQIMSNMMREAKKDAKGKGKTSSAIETMFQQHKARWFKLKSRNSLEILNALRIHPAGVQILIGLDSTLDELANSTAYIGPVRVHPARYYLTEDAGQSVDQAGKNSIPLLYDWKKHQQRRYKDVVDSIQLLELATKIDTRSGLDEILKLDVQPFEHTERVGFADVGFGISQALPILVADAALPKGGTLLVNQPEVHLHPSSQALLGDYFASRLKTRRYILETHSEYLINRLRLLAVQGKLNVKDVSILFFEAPSVSTKTPTIHCIEIGEDGSLINAPKSFFQTYFLDTFNLALGGFQENAHSS